MQRNIVRDRVRSCYVFDTANWSEPHLSKPDVFTKSLPATTKGNQNSSVTAIFLQRIESDQAPNSNKLAMKATIAKPIRKTAIDLAKPIINAQPLSD